MAVHKFSIRQLETSNWNANGSCFHVFNSPEELKHYLNRSKTGKWWREEYGKFDFEQCLFNFEVTQWVNEFDHFACFKNATFKDQVSFKGIRFKEGVDFGGCWFSGHADFSHCIFEKDFDSTSFQGGVSFHKATFKKHVIFWKQSFKGPADFSNAHFAKGADFACSAFSDLSMHHAEFVEDTSFEEVEFNGKVNGWNMVFLKDISFQWANFREKVTFTRMRTENGNANFHGSNFAKNAYFYDGIFNELDLSKSVIDKGIYFLGSVIRNANRETWRLIKHEFIKLNNKIESLNYHALEMMEYEKELFGARKVHEISFIRFLKDFCQVFTKGDRTNKFVVFANRISNGYNLLPFRGVSFTISATLLSYLLFIYVVKLEADIEFEYSYKHIGLNFKQALQFMNITNWKYYPFNMVEYEWAYGVLFLGRIIVGYGIYQTIQAFRKYGRI